MTDHCKEGICTRFVHRSVFVRGREEPILVCGCTCEACWTISAPLREGQRSPVCMTEPRNIEIRRVLRLGGLQLSLFERAA